MLMNSIEHIKEVHSVAISAFWELVGNVHHEDGVIGHVSHHVGNTEFVVIRDVNPLDFTKLEQLLLPR